MTTPAQREAVLMKLHYFFGDDPSKSQSLRRRQADEIIAAYEAAAPEDLRPTLICKTCGLTAIVAPPKDPAHDR